MENSNNTKPVPEAEPKNNSEPQEQQHGEAPNQSSLTGGVGGGGGVADEALPPPLQQQQSSRRTPFTNLSQVDADLALARALQEQERAYMMLRMGNDGSEYGSWDAGSYLHDEEDEDEDDDDEDDDHFGDPDHGNGEGEDDTDVDDANDVDAFDAHANDEAGIDEDEDDEDDDEDDYDEDDDDDEEDDNPGVELDPALFSSDEAYARALQDAEEREMTSRLFALTGLHDLGGEDEDMEEHGQDAWEEVDPDELSYEELLALGEVVGTESRGLSADRIALLPSIKYKAGSTQSGSNDSCVICRLDYEEDEDLTLLSCKHSYHSECINNWLKINKVCPVCSAEVSTSGHS